MSSRKSMQRQVMYNRQSKAWQQNQMKNQMAQAGFANGAPKTPSSKKMRNIIIIGLIVWVALTVLLTIKFHWIGLLVGFVIGGALTGVMILYLRKKEDEILRYYKSMGLPKQEFFKQMKKNSKAKLSEKQMKKMSKKWDKIEVKTPALNAQAKKK